MIYIYHAPNILSANTTNNIILILNIISLNLIGCPISCLFFCNMEIINKNNIRNMRICKHYLQRKYARGCNVPEIRLRGKWLMNAGFNIGDYISITITDGVLTITIDKKTTTP